MSYDSDDDVTLVKGGDGNDQSLVRFDDSHVTGDERSNDSNLPSHVLSDSDIAARGVWSRKQLTQGVLPFSRIVYSPCLISFIAH
jgi:hypothetical protein